MMKPASHARFKQDITPHSLPGSLLDHIASHPDINSACPLYTLVNYQKGGAMVEAYERGRSKELERFAREELCKYLYRNGEGVVVSMENMEANYNNNEVVIAMDERNPCSDDDLERSHRTYWRLEYRGFLGENPLHVLIFCNTPMHNRIARVLLKVYPGLVYDIIEGDDYYGASALHLAIGFRNTELASILVQNGAKINQRATGLFFLPFDQQMKKRKKQTDFASLFYFGEYPLAWAACTEDEAMYNLLLKHGANPDMRDSFGNTVLHMVVIQNKLSMYGYALRHPLKPARDNILNNYGLTPLTLACKLGRNKIFIEMLELSALEFWRYSNITCSGYPLNALDSLLPNGKTNWNSALMIILNGKTNEHLDMLDGGVIQRLLEEKWKTFARQQFLKRLALMFLHLITLSIATYLRPEAEQPLLGDTDAKSIVRYIAEIGTCIGCATFIIFQEAKEIKVQGILVFLLNLTSNAPKALFFLSDILTLLCIPCRLADQRHMEDFLLSFALTGSWLFLIFFAGAVHLTGPFITMIYKMITGDMFRFSIIYVIFILGFTQAFWFVSQNAEGDNELPESYFETWMSLFHYALGVYEYTDFDDTVYPLLTKVVFTVFMIIMPILLLNMLIAMMGNTYCKVIVQSEREWMRQWAKIVLALERAVPQVQAREYLHSYSIPFPSTEENPDLEQRAVIVIKTKPKSKAKQRKGALTNWKRVGKRLVSALRQCGGTAEGVRSKYFGDKARHASSGKQKTVKGDDSETDGLLGVALNQLAFAHNLDLGKATSVTTGSGSSSPNYSEKNKHSVSNSLKDSEAFVPCNDFDQNNVIAENACEQHLYQQKDFPDTEIATFLIEQKISRLTDGTENSAFIPDVNENNVQNCQFQDRNLCKTDIESLSLAQYSSELENAEVNNVEKSECKDHNRVDTKSTFFSKSHFCKKHSCRKESDRTKMKSVKVKHKTKKKVTKHNMNTDNSVTESTTDHLNNVKINETKTDCSDLEKTKVKLKRKFQKKRLLVNPNLHDIQECSETETDGSESGLHLRNHLSKPANKRSLGMIRPLRRKWRQNRVHQSSAESNTLNINLQKTGSTSESGICTHKYGLTKWSTEDVMSINNIVKWDDPFDDSLL